MFLFQALAFVPLAFVPQWSYATSTPDLANEIYVFRSPVIWDLEGTTDKPYSTAAHDWCTLDGMGHASAKIDGRTSHMDASGEAYDTCTGDDVRVSEAGTSTYGMGFHYIGTREGFASVTASVEANGVANLNDDDCAAAALGYAEFECSIALPIAAVLDKSIGETVDQALGNLVLALQGLSVQVPLYVSHGEGKYADNKQDSMSGVVACSLVGFNFTANVRGYIQTWANSYLAGNSYCRARMWSRIHATISLSECN